MKNQVPFAIPAANLPSLPVTEHLAKIRAALEPDGASLLLSAEPGAGKSTLVPLAFPDAPWLNGRRIIMLEPRRIAARASASRMAFLLGEKCGGHVGYRTGTDTVCGRDTVIEVVTEAILTRMIRNNPELPDVGLIIFDEFHERSIHADLGLALALDVRENLRPDLRITVMSATLELPALQRLLPDASTIHIPGRMFPVKTLHTGVIPPGATAVEEAKLIAGTVRNALNHFPGDTLVFLPGEGEIHRVQQELDALNADGLMKILPLYGNLSAADQDRVFTPETTPDARRVILSTAIAETSLTIDGVRIVVDSGWMRIPRFSPANGMDRLETIRVSLASAEQRRGRAGRTAEGVCIRMWTDVEERSFEAHRPPEIMETDLCELTLELLNWGVPPDKVHTMPFPDAPPDVHLQQAVRVLQDLGAADDNLTLTPHGRQLLDLPVHPRAGHMILTGCSEEAVRLAAILAEKDFVRTDSADLALRLDALGRDRGIPCDHGAKSRILQNMDRLRRLLPQDRKRSIREPGQLLALAYPERVAKKRETTLTGTGPVQYTLANGVTAELDRNDPLTRFDFLAVGETSTHRGITKIRLAAPLAENDLHNLLSNCIRERFEAVWDNNSKSVRCYRVKAHGSLVLEKKQVSDPPAETVLAVFLEGIRKTGFQALDLSKNELAFRNRVTFLHKNGYADDYPDLSEAGLMEHLEDWLAPFVSGFKRLEDLKKLNYRAILESTISPRALMAMRELAPEKLEVPSGSHISLDYSDPMQPAVSVRLQEIFGLKKAPQLAGGRVPLLMDILSPAMRTVQKTKDLESFWKESYFLVRKDMRGRYPKHDWPEDPTQAVAHRGVRRPKTDH